MKKSGGAKWMICNDLLGKGEKLGNSIGLECTQGNVKQIKHLWLNNYDTYPNAASNFR